jgi:uncharacterized protein with PIN domain
MTGMKQACFEFDEELRFFLSPQNRGGKVCLSFQGPQSTKHLIESLGVPHTEIGWVQSNGHRISLDYQVQDGDRLEVHAIVRSASRPDLEPAEAVPEPCFVLDGHLGRLAAYLRMLGFDCLYRSDYTDDELTDISVNHDRILLTRDRRLLMKKVIRRGYCLRSLNPTHQLEEVVLRFGLKHWVRPFQRCLRCNARLQPVSKEEVLERLEPLTKQYFEEFRLCPACKQIYWKGSHYEKMLKMIERLTSSSG